MERDPVGLKSALEARVMTAHLLGALRGLARLDSRKVRERWARDGLLREVNLDRPRKGRGWPRKGRELRTGLDRVDPLGLAEAEERQGSRDCLEEIRLAKETSRDVARTRRTVVLLNRDLVVPLETVEMVANLRSPGRSEGPLEETTTSRVCSRGRAVNFLKELVGWQSTPASWISRRW